MLFRSGWLHVSSPIELEIVDGTDAVQLDDRSQALLPPGARDLRFVNRALGFAETVLMPRYYDGREAAMRMIRVLRAPGPLPLNWQPPVLGEK